MIQKSNKKEMTKLEKYRTIAFIVSQPFVIFAAYVGFEITRVFLKDLLWALGAAFLIWGAGSGVVVQKVEDEFIRREKVKEVERKMEKRGS